MNTRLPELLRRLAGRRGELVHDMGWGLGYELTSLFSAICTFLLLARALHPAGFGYYSAIGGLVAVSGTFTSGWGGFVLLEDVLRDGADLTKTFRRLISSLAVCAAIVLLVTVGIARPLIHTVPIWITVTYVAAEAVGASSVKIAASAIQAVHGFAASTRPTIVLQALGAAAIVVLWLAHSLSLASAGVATLAVNLVVGAGAILLCVKRCRLSPGLASPPREQLRRGLLYAIALLCFVIEEDSDKVLLVHFGYSTIGGIYSAAYRIVQMGLIPLRVMVSATHNRFLAHDENARNQHWRRSVIFTIPSAIYGVVAVSALIVCAPLAPDVLGHAYAGTATMIRWIGFLILFRSVTMFPFNGLMGLGHRGLRTAVLATSAVVNLTLSVLLIPSMSWKACVLATFVGESLFCALAWLVLLREQRAHDRAVDTRVSTEPAPELDRTAL